MNWRLSAKIREIGRESMHRAGEAGRAMAAFYFGVVDPLDFIGAAANRGIW
jgi:hypothetical protein